MIGDLHSLIVGIWAAVGVLWGILWLGGATAGTQPARVESRASRLAHLALMAAAFWLLFATNPPIGALNQRVVADTTLGRYAGLGATIAGLGLTVWARLILGRNWSAVVTIKQDHRLVRTGPYKWVRHPIYSGLLLAMLGTAIFLCEWRGLVGFGVGLAGFWLKARLEERFLIEQFGPEYAEYKKKVKALIPAVL